MLRRKAEPDKYILDMIRTGSLQAKYAFSAVPVELPASNKPTHQRALELGAISRRCDLVASAIVQLRSPDDTPTVAC